MSEQKTAEEIVKALRCCGNTDTKKPDCEHCPLLSTRMCVKVMLEGAADLIESQQSQLAESQRREQAAVNDLEELLELACKAGVGECCDYCSDNSEDCTGCTGWRGPQEAGKEDSNA